MFYPLARGIAAPVALQLHGGEFLKHDHERHTNHALVERLEGRIAAKFAQRTRLLFASFSGGGYSRRMDVSGTIVHALRREGSKVPI